MDKVDLVKQAYMTAWKGYEDAILEIAPGREGMLGIQKDLPQLSPMAAQIYRQLSSVVYLNVPSGIDVSTKELLRDILEQAGVKAVILPDVIEVTPTEEDDT